jgi:hypothetical protein
LLSVDVRMQKLGELRSPEDGQMEIIDWAERKRTEVRTARKERKQLEAATA